MAIDISLDQISFLTAAEAVEISLDQISFLAATQSIELSLDQISFLASSEAPSAGSSRRRQAMVGGF